MDISWLFTPVFLFKNRLMRAKTTKKIAVLARINPRISHLN
jgi:hypothetical protein